MGSAAGSSGTGTGSFANVYTPKQQGAADDSFIALMNSLLVPAGNAGAGTPAAEYLPTAENLAANFLTGALPGTVGYSADGSYPLNAAAGGSQRASQTAADYGNDTLFPRSTSAAESLNTSSLGGLPAADQALSAGFDPQLSKFRRGEQQLIDQSNAINSMYGLGGTPYGASVTSNALSNYDIDWASKQLDRQKTAAGTYDTLLGGAGRGLTRADLLGSGAATDVARLGDLPYSTGATIGKNALTAETDLTKLANDQYTLPQNLLDDLLKYLDRGQSASVTSGKLGELGEKQTSSAVSGGISAATGLSSLLFGAPTKGLLSLLPGGGS